MTVGPTDKHLFSHCGETEDDTEEGKNIYFDTKCGNKHNTSQTVLKLHRRLADEIQRPENTWRKDKSRKQKEKLILRQWEDRGKDGGGEKGTISSSPLRVDLPLQIFSIMSPYYYCKAMVFILFRLFQSNTGYLSISERWQDADDMLVQRIFLYFVSSVLVKTSCI